MHANFPEKGFTGVSIDDENGKYLEFRHLINMDKYFNVWIKTFSNALGCLAQGIRDLPGTDTIDSIPHSDVPFWTTVR